MKNNEKTHATKAKSYDIGRPEYPAAFFDFLYNDAAFKTEDVIADIGCGTGKVTRHFLERGNQVIAVEPDIDMLSIANEKLNKYPNYISSLRYADDTFIESASIDHIFCGNSYHWFCRKTVVPEFKRILRQNGTIVIANLGNGINKYDDALEKIYKKYVQPATSVNANTSAPFLSGTFIEKTFDYTVHETLNEFLHGLLSASFAPKINTDTYESFCHEIKDLFIKYCKDERLETNMKLSCMIGNADNLAMTD